MIDSAGARRLWLDPRWRNFRYALLATVLWRSILLGVSFAGFRLFPLDRAFRHSSPFGPNAYWNGWCRWDAEYYRAIADLGYQAGGITPAFFPLFPYSARAVSVVTGNTWVALLVTAHAYLLLGVWMLYRLALLKMDERDAKRAVVLLLAFPASFFFGAAYSEASFIFCVAATFYFFERKRFWAVGLCGALAAADRATGILLLPALCLDQLRAHGIRGWSRKDLGLLWLFFIPFGLLAFVLLLKHATGSYTAFVQAQQSWGRSLSWPWDTVLVEIARARSGHVIGADASMVVTLNLLATALLLAASFAAIRPFGWAYFGFAFLACMSLLFSGYLESACRVAATTIPLTLVLVRWTRDQRVERCVLLVSVLLLALLMTRFVNGYWMT